MFIRYRDDVFQGEEHHPQCPFFEQFPSSLDPDEDFYGELFCHMDETEESAERCLGDYLKCPLAYGGKNAAPKDDTELPFDWESNDDTPF